MRHRNRQTRPPDVVIIPANKPRPLEFSQGPTIPERLPLVSLVIACMGQLQNYTVKLVESLEANAGTAYELILIDNGCPEGTYDWATHRGIKCLKMGENVGVPRAYNAGVREAKGGLIGVWNNDMICHPGGVSALARASYERGIAAQSAGMWTEHGSYAGPTMEFYWSDYAECYAMIAQRKVWEDVGEWDPVFVPSYCDDADFCIRARLKGYDWRLVENAVTHFGGKTAEHVPGIHSKVAAHQQIIRDRYLPLGLGQRILVQRWGAHGDLLMATPAIRALKTLAPLARLHVHTSSAAGQVLLGNPHVDAVFENPTPSRAYSKTVNLNNAYERGQPHGVFAHPVTAFCAEAKVKFDGKPLDLYVSPSSRAWAKGVMSEYAPPGTTLIAAGLRSGTRSKQNWHAVGWRSLAASLPSDTRLVALDAGAQPPLGHVAHPGEDEAAFYAHPRVIDLTGKTRDFTEMAALISACDGFIGVDSGPQHVASALGLPQVVLSAGSPLSSRLALTGLRVGFEGVAPCMAPGCGAPDRCSRVDGPHCLSHVSGADVWNAFRGLVAEE